jgi:hypothetical protein
LFILCRCKVVPGGTPPKDTDFRRDIYTSHRFPDVPFTITSIDVAIRPPDTITQIVSQFICTFNRENTIAFIVPRGEVIARLRRQLHIEYAFSILHVEKFPYTIYIPESGATIEQLNSCISLPSPQPHVLISWQPAVSPNINLFAVPDTPDKALFQQYQPMFYTPPSGRRKIVSRKLPRG